MRAAVLHGPSDIRLQDWPDPVAGPGEIVLRVGATAFCGTDMRIIRGKKTKDVRFPTILGHEFAGQIVAVGAGLTEFKVDDCVGVDPVYPCGRCAYCLAGRENVCLNRQAMGYEFDGAFAEYVRIPAVGVARGNVFRLPSGIDWAKAALAEPLACVLNGQENMGLSLGDRVVIIGAGPIGIMHLKLALLAGARQVIAVEPSASRRAAAQRLGATVVDPGSGDVKAFVKDATDGLGADAVIVAIGVPAVANQALTLARKGGRINLFAGFSAGDMPPIDVNLIHYNELVVTGASALKRRHFGMALNLIASGRLDVADLVTHRLPLGEFARAMALAEAGEGLKIVVEGMPQ
jgi:L-iditol 2-dehydrogenase